jgi:uncharacterized membrane protein YvbJ
MSQTCPACGHDSSKTYRCEDCGHDLAGESSTAGRQGVER